MPACSGVRSPLRALQRSQAATQLVQLDVPPLRARQDVVDRDRLGPRLRTAVLAGVVVALGDVAPAERHRRVRQPVVSAPGR